jgi:hypothetical protein
MTHTKQLLIVLALCTGVPYSLNAHCDTMDGPVVKAAKMALTQEDISPILKWVKPEDEPEMRSAFQRALQVRRLGPEARELADNYFFETLVRIHRAGEGAPFTGLKPSGSTVEPGIALADKALERGSAEELVRQVNSEVAASIRQRFAAAQAASKHADDTVAAGRAFVAAYVGFIHLVERLHQAGSGAAHPAEGRNLVPAEHGNYLE